MIIISTNRDYAWNVLLFIHDVVRRFFYFKLYSSSRRLVMEQIFTECLLGDGTL